MIKALKWPQIKSENGKPLIAYAVFLSHTTNAKVMEEMDNPTHMQIVASRLPQKLRERWQHAAFEIKENTGRKIRLADTVMFIDCQTMETPFGKLQDNQTSTSEKSRGKRSPSKVESKEATL